MTYLSTIIVIIHNNNDKNANTQSTESGSSSTLQLFNSCESLLVNLKPRAESSVTRHNNDLAWQHLRSLERETFSRQTPRLHCLIRLLLHRVLPLHLEKSAGRISSLELFAWPALFHHVTSRVRSHHFSDRVSVLPIARWRLWRVHTKIPPIAHRDSFFTSSAD